MERLNIHFASQVLGPAVAELTSRPLNTVTPKLQLGISLFLLLVITPGGVWALVHDVRRGETTHISKWGRKTVYRRAERPRDFWGMIGYTAFAGLVGFTLGAWALYDALRRF